MLAKKQADDDTLLPSGLSVALVKRLHNEPKNADLGPCECPVCRPDLQPVKREPVR